jgi:hypothetical protein
MRAQLSSSVSAQRELIKKRARARGEGGGGGVHTNKHASKFLAALLQLALTETTFPSALCVIRSLSYLDWSKTFLLGVGLTDLGDLGRHLGGNKAIVGAFNGPV